ncbi:unnamed protein product, partial [marine sediment metagenome]
IINKITTFVILISSAVIIALEAASSCTNFWVIGFSGVIFVLKGANEIFKLDTLGFTYKNGTIQLRRISRELKGMMYKSFNYNIDQILSTINRLTDAFDEIDLGLYKMSSNNQANYTSGGFEVQQSRGVERSDSVPQNQEGPVLVDNKNNSLPHVHIHLESTPQPENNNNNDEVVIPIEN